MLCRVALVRIGVLEERSASIIRVTRICELGTTLAATNDRRTPLIRSVNRLIVATNVVSSSPILVTLMMGDISSETSVLTRATWREIQED
jgi:hypothetical protein